MLGRRLRIGSRMPAAMAMLVFCYCVLRFAAVMDIASIIIWFVVSVISFVVDVGR